MHLDNGTNFVGSERILRADIEVLKSVQEVHSFCKVEAIELSFKPPKTPHFGGAHESLVRSAKRTRYAAL